MDVHVGHGIVRIDGDLFGLTVLVFHLDRATDWRGVRKNTGSDTAAGRELMSDL
jgi:hypothetical protein